MKRITVKPTMRRNGLMMFPVKIEFTVSRDHLIAIGTMKALNEEKLPETRYEWLNLLANGLREYGDAVTPDYLTGESYAEEDIRNARKLAAERISGLFPDLLTTSE